MKAKFYVQVSCPKCTWVMYNYEDHIECENPDCHFYHVQWERPSVDLINKALANNVMNDDPEPAAEVRG